VFSDLSFSRRDLSRSATEALREKVVFDRYLNQVRALNYTQFNQLMHFLICLYTWRNFTNTSIVLSYTEWQIYIIHRYVIFAVRKQSCTRASKNSKFRAQSDRFRRETWLTYTLVINLLRGLWVRRWSQLCGWQNKLRKYLTKLVHICSTKIYICVFLCNLYIFSI